LVANFAPVVAGNFAVNLSSSPAAGGTNTGSGSFASGSNVTITAAANAGYTFVNWTDNGVVASASSSFQFTLTGNRTLVANYRLIPSSQFSVILSSSPAAGGTTDGEGSYNAGTSVTVVATHLT
jgi:phage terminase large subunit GpA-like protein